MYNICLRFSVRPCVWWFFFGCCCVFFFCLTHRLIITHSLASFVVSNMDKEQRRNSPGKLQRESEKNILLTCHPSSRKPKLFCCLPILRFHYSLYSFSVYNITYLFRARTFFLNYTSSIFLLIKGHRDTAASLMWVELYLCSAMFTQEWFPSSLLMILSLFTLIMVNALNDYDRFRPAFWTKHILDSFLTISFQILWRPDEALCIHLNTANAGESRKSSEVGLGIRINQIMFAGQKKMFQCIKQSIQSI